MKPTMPVAVVVDDDPVIQQIATTVLGDEGFDVVTASNAVDAMAHVRGSVVDLLIVDLSLPGMDGFTFLAGVRRLKLAPFARVVIASGRDDQAAFSRGRELGVDDYLVKPINVVDLVTLARTTTSRQSGS